MQVTDHKTWTTLPHKSHPGSAFIGGDAKCDSNEDGVENDSTLNAIEAVVYRRRCSSASLGSSGIYRADEGLAALESSSSSPAQSKSVVSRLVCRAAAGLDRRAACRQWQPAIAMQQTHSSKWCSQWAKAFLTAQTCTMMAGGSGAAPVGASF